MNRNSTAFRIGMRDGIPIALGYITVAFSLGIMASSAGLNPFQGFLSGLLNHASAGEYAELTAILTNASYIEVALIILVTNSRYLLMSCALSQKIKSGTSLPHRLLMGFGITDEIFAISVSQSGNINPYYSYGAMLISLPSWAAGGAIGIVAGNILPANVVSALSIAIYGMFLAIVIPVARKEKSVFFVVAASFVLSYVFTKIPLLTALPESIRVIILTVALSSAAAIIFPVKKETECE